MTAPLPDFRPNDAHLSGTAAWPLGKILAENLGTRSLNAFAIEAAETLDTFAALRSVNFVENRIVRYARRQSASAIRRSVFSRAAGGSIVPS